MSLFKPPIGMFVLSAGMALCVSLNQQVSHKVGGCRSARTDLFVMHKQLTRFYAGCPHEGMVLMHVSNKRAQAREFRLWEPW
eukprot:1155792-Pelagomonas_calceolata.AAC.4